MDSNDFNKLISLLSKLDNATTVATATDGSFKKYHTHSIEVLKDMPIHLKRIEQGLRTARILK
jgi:hypothetical protein